MTPERGKPLRRAVFLDRDGTLNVEKEYLFRCEDFEWIPGAVEAVGRLRAAGFLVIVITNQSGVARGYFGLAEVATLHQHLQQQLSHFHTRIDAFYVCPHHPNEGLGDFRCECDCRKGKPGMLLQAASEHGIDLHHSYMVGDKVADIEAGLAAGCHALLVLTGHGHKEVEKLPAASVPTFTDLPAAADWIINQKH